MGKDKNRNDLAIDVIAAPLRRGLREAIGGAGEVAICRILQADSWRRQSPGIGLVENKGIEEVESNIHCGGTGGIKQRSERRIRAGSVAAR